MTHSIDYYVTDWGFSWDEEYTQESQDTIINKKYERENSRFESDYSKGIKRDIKKDEYLKSNGFEVLRFDNHEINRKMDWVEENILLILERRLSEFAVECPVVLVGDE